MSATERLARQLRQADDPAATLAYADLLEEAGANADEVRRWRLYGRWHAMLDEAIADIIADIDARGWWYQRVVRPAPGLTGHRVTIIWADSVMVTVEALGPTYFAEIRLWWLSSRLLAQPRYLRNRARGMVDSLWPHLEV